MTPEELAEQIRLALIAAVSAERIQLSADDVPALVKVERPRSREHGDWATNIAMQLGKKAGVAPRELAEILAETLSEHPSIEAIDIAGPGFMNITLTADSAGELPRSILAAGDSYGKGDALAGSTVNLEFVSANPTGPVHLGGARWAAVGDSLARLMEAEGAQVVREYYFNDHGRQIDRFAASLYARAKGLPAPEDGYGGEYITDIADRVRAGAISEGLEDPVNLPEDEALEAFRSRGVALMFDEVKAELHDFRTDFDVFFHEDTLHESGAVDEAINRLRQRGVIYEEDGATWLRSTDFGDDKDRVLIKSNGDAAYFSGDVAYYLDKRGRGADNVIILLGADHHGYVGRMMAMCAAFGDEPYVNLQLLIGQMVNLVKDGEPVRMSKRAGTVVTLSDLVDIVGVDAARYALVRVSLDTDLDIDLDLLSSRTNDNPVYYVQYAYARTRSVARNAAEHGVPDDLDYVASELNHPADEELLATLARYPSVVAQAAVSREPHRVARYLEEVASAYHQWYGQCRVTPRADDPVDGGHIARLQLNNAVSTVLKAGLGLLGVEAPEKM
ncbi:arginine--tRNA ligase [Actinomycetaceae bacterium WB03_NA08]|uniref:Arginine--tRNA ligase n=1 Tax=Scrofimicrobium canadense TaxID=2652290 RepID=A0A6N7VSG1_9ACTO|nr:arginine--tRNA ligase [Scrofimicrobium canadense]MSS84714.1 arginine--tRNA ligase [Scrofimicrobium canadense]